MCVFASALCFLQITTVASCVLIQLAGLHLLLEELMQVTFRTVFERNVFSG
jgi:hypothetical protein